MNHAAFRNDLADGGGDAVMRGEGIGERVLHL